MHKTAMVVQKSPQKSIFPLRSPCSNSPKCALYHLRMKNFFVRIREFPFHILLHFLSVCNPVLYRGQFSTGTLTLPSKTGNYRFVNQKPNLSDDSSVIGVIILLFFQVWPSICRFLLLCPSNGRLQSTVSLTAAEWRRGDWQRRYST